MDRLVVFLIASLLFHPSSPSKTTKPGREPKATTTQLLENVSLVRSLAQTFNQEEAGSRSSSASCTVGPTIPIPFSFPIADSYDMDLSKRLSKGTKMSPQRVFGVLVQIIYSLLQFHIKRLFKLDPSKPFISNPTEQSGERWEDNPQDWFVILLCAIMPGARVIVYTRDEPVKVKRIYVKPFQSLESGDYMLEYSAYRNGIPKIFSMRYGTDKLTVPIHLLPSPLFGRELAPGQPIMQNITLQKSYPHCRKILDHLLKGVTFAFDLSHAEPEVIVGSTQDIPLVEQSRDILKELFEAQIKTQMVVPENIEGALEERILPKTSCYHPTKLPFNSPELYEQMLALIIAYGILEKPLIHGSVTVTALRDDLELWLKQFLPDCSVKVSKMESSTSETRTCTYNPNTSSMWIYKGNLNGKKMAISLELGKPVTLNHIQMNAIGKVVFPFAFRTSMVEAANTPGMQILRAIATKLRISIIVEKGTTSITPELSTKDESNVPRESTLHISSGTASDSISPEGRKLPAAFLHSLDTLSRNYAHNAASHFESPKVQTKIYQRSRQVSLNSFFGMKVLIVFNADKLPLVKATLLEETVFSLHGGEGTNSKHGYYVSWHMKHFIPGEGTELIYFVPTPNAHIPSSASFREHLKSPIFNNNYTNEITCQYPARGDLSELKGQLRLKFTANGQRVLPDGRVLSLTDWPLRLTVMANVLEAFQTTHLLTKGKSEDPFSVGPLAFLETAFEGEIVSYAPHLRQFDLIDTSKPVAYVRHVEDTPEGVTSPILPMYWKIPDCYLLAVRPADGIVQEGTTLIWAVKVESSRPFEVSRLTLEWFHEHRDELTPTALYKVLGRRDLFGHRKQ